MLYECGANVEVRDYRGRTPLLLAADLDRYSLDYREPQDAILQMLLFDL